jgi:DNA-directed RNA polymerase subunit RPC12/RpoP
VRHVPGVDWIKQRVCPQPEYRRPGSAGAACFNLLHDLCPGLSSSQVKLKINLQQLGERVDDDHSQLTNIDIEKRTTRGRACPMCGGKIIPSDRAVYQNTTDPIAVYPLWQCERCGYQELVERAQKVAKKH